MEKEYIIVFSNGQNVFDLEGGHMQTRIYKNIKEAREAKKAFLDSYKKDGFLYKAQIIKLKIPSSF